MPEKILFLPGAAGRTRIWENVASLLPTPAEMEFVGWPGFGETPPDPDVRGIDDLLARVVARIDRPTALFAQSMGGIIAVRAALARPQWVTHLVLAVTSGGVDVASLGAEDWREAFGLANPQLPDWFCHYREDVSAHLASLAMPALLLWGDADPISPVAVGEHLATLLPCARLHVIEGGDHDLVQTHAAHIAPLIAAHLGLSPAGRQGADAVIFSMENVRSGRGR